MNLIIVSGAEATCKTAIGKHIAHSLGYRYQSKDIIKEHLFDTESMSTWNYGWYEKRAKDLFFADIQALIQANADAVIESNFRSGDKVRLVKLLQGNSVQLSEIYCRAKGFTSFKRFVHRNETKARHPGHHDRRWYLPVFFQCCVRFINVMNIYTPTKLTNKLLTVDTTDYSRIDLQEIITFINSSQLDIKTVMSRAKAGRHSHSQKY